MLLDPNELPQDLEALTELILDQNEKIGEKDAEIERLKEMIVLLRRRQFAPKSEKLSVDEQADLFNEFEEVAASVVAENDEPEETIEVPAHSRKVGKRKKLPEELPRQEVHVELPESERVCSCCQLPMEKCGEEVSEKLDVIPMQAKVIRTIRHKYACRSCEDGVKTAPVPAQALPKSMASEGLLAAIATWKFVDHLPLYRVEAMLKRVGVDISRGTMAHWMMGIGELFMPLINLLDETLVESSYLQSDETRVQVLKEKGKTAQSLSYMWVRARPGPEPIILFEYDPTRSGDVPLRLLRDFKGALQADGYDGYNEVTAKPEVLRLGCFAHCRRKFHDAWKSSKKAGIANKALIYIQKLYKIERACEGKSVEERFAIRQAKAKPLLEEMKIWMDQVRATVPPENFVGKALNYANNEWQYLVRYIEDGRYEIDNNLIENAIRPFALGRKNWLFSNSVAGAKASAAIYSLLVTAKANGVDPYRYLRYVLEKLPRAKTLDDIEMLLPSKAKSALQ